MGGRFFSWAEFGGQFFNWEPWGDNCSIDPNHPICREAPKTCEKGKEF